LLLFLRILGGDSGAPFPPFSSVAPPPPPVPIALDSLVGSNIAAADLNAILSSSSQLSSYDSENSSHCSDGGLGAAAVSPTAGGSGDVSSGASVVAIRGDSGGRRRVCRDDRILAGLGIPFTAATIINCSMEEFNSILVNSGLSEDQVNTCRDMRRRGKNKIAAQNCRKRKVDQISTLTEEVEDVRARKARLLRERARLRSEEAAWRDRLVRMEARVRAELARRGGVEPPDGQLAEQAQVLQLVS
jgi:hypothetical protein